MDALVVHEPDRFSVEDVPRPSPGENEVLCKVHAVALCGTDPHIIAGDYPGFWPKSFPFIPGHEWSGEVVEVGPGADAFGWTVGTRVAGTSHAGCGFCRKCVEGATTSARTTATSGCTVSTGTTRRARTPTTSSTRSRASSPSRTRSAGTRARCSTRRRSRSTRSSAAAHSPGDTVVVVGPGVMGLLVAECARRARRGPRARRRERRAARQGGLAAGTRRSTSPARIPSRACAS